MDLDLIVAREPIHEGKILVSGTVIDNLVDGRSWKGVLGTCMVEMEKIGVDANSALFFVSGDGVGNP